MDESLSSDMKDGHRRCDRLLAACETASDSREWSSLDQYAEAFATAMEHHFRIEEEVLFPELEETAAQSMGPTSVMRMEHGQMRQLLASLESAVSERDREACLGVLETLHMFVQQHNAKEEGVLYPLADASLSARAAAIRDRFKALQDRGS